jgi:hypothetical protein
MYEMMSSCWHLAANRWLLVGDHKVEVGDKFVLFDYLTMLFSWVGGILVTTRHWCMEYDYVPRIHGNSNIIYKDLVHIWILLFFSVPLNVLILGVTMGSMSATQLDIFCSDSMEGLEKELRTITETKLTKIYDITTDSNTTTQTRQQCADSVHKTRRLA